MNDAGADPMNLDDFIFSENAATPAGVSSPQPSSIKITEGQASNAHSSAIPIKSRKDTAQFVPQSLPQHGQGDHSEFHYIQRHHRKTSIDDRRVSKLISS